MLSLEDLKAFLNVPTLPATAFQSFYHHTPIFIFNSDEKIDREENRYIASVFWNWLSKDSKTHDVGTNDIYIRYMDHAITYFTRYSFEYEEWLHSFKPEILEFCNVKRWKLKQTYFVHAHKTKKYSKNPDKITYCDHYHC